LHGRPTPLVVDLCPKGVRVTPVRFPQCWSLELTAWGLVAGREALPTPAIGIYAPMRGGGCEAAEDGCGWLWGAASAVAEEVRSSRRCR
jgi:hypothetical protein